MNSTNRTIAKRTLSCLLLISAAAFLNGAHAHFRDLSVTASVATKPSNYAARAYQAKNIYPVARHGVYYVIPRALPLLAQPVDGDGYEEAYDDIDEFDATDSDNDGFISFREARRANPDWARDFRRIDVSGDGYLTREEIEAFYRK